MSFKLFSPAEKLTAMAFASWLCSLALTSFLLYSGNRFPGAQVFTSGWLSPLIPNFAWFANIFFFYCIHRLFAGKTPVIASLLTILVSLDTFRLDRLPLNAGGAESAIYGYGWGVVFWLLSFCLILWAVGARRRESDQLIELFGIRDILQPIGFILALTLLGTVSYLSIEDRKLANLYETPRLSGITFKREKVCSTPEPTINHPIEKFTGPLEIILENNASVYPFTQIKELLAWGIPIVRINNIDYSYAQNGLISSVTATSKPAATLHVSESEKGSISAKLLEASTDRIVFDQTWNRENQPRSNRNYYCPDYHYFPKLDEQPRKIISQALNLVGTNKSEHTDLHYLTSNSIEGVIIEKSNDGLTREMKIARWKAMNPDKKVSSMPSLSNTSCPNDIGWNKTNDRLYRLDLGWPFLVRDRSYYLSNRENHNAICDSKSTYIYHGFRVERDNKYRLIIEKRNLQNFQQIWAIKVNISDLEHVTRDDVLKIESVKHVENTLILELVNDDTGQILFVELNSIF